MMAWMVSMLQALVLWVFPPPPPPTVILLASSPDGADVRRIPLPATAAQVHCDAVRPTVDVVRDESDFWKLRHVEKNGTVTCRGELQSPEALRMAYRIADDWDITFTVEGITNPRGW